MAGPARVLGVARRVRAVEPALLLLAAMVFVVQVGVAVMLPLLPLYARSMGAPPVVLGLLTSIFAVTNAFGQLITGFLAERLEMRRLLAAGIGSYAFANFLIASASTAGALVAFRAFAGVGGGVMLVGERLYLVQLVEPAQLAFANGVLSAAGSAGSVAGPAIGGLLASLADLRLPFVLVGVTSLLATIGALFLPRAVRPATPQPVSPTPAVAERDQTATTATRVAAPAQPVRRQLAVLLLAQIGLMSGFGSFITTYGPFAEERLGWSTAEIGFVFALFGLGSILLGPWLARQADLRGRRDVGIIGTLPVIAFAAAYWLEAPGPVLYAASILAGAGVTTVGSAWYALLADATEGGRRGRRFGTIAALGNLGIVVGGTLAAQLWEATGDVAVGFVIAGVSVAVCALALLAHPRDRPGGSSVAPSQSHTLD
jgi:MFS family permease